MQLSAVFAVANSNMSRPVKTPTRRRLRLRFSNSNQLACSALQLTFMQLASLICNTLLARSHDRVTANVQRDRLQTDEGGERLPAAEREGIQIVGGGRRRKGIG